jgi:endonuclease YncB( thermonuclease family)
MSTASQTLSQRHYTTLRRDIQTLLKAGAASADQRRVEAYWQIGERIAEEKLTAEAGYHNSVLRDLARDTATSISTLQRAVAFRETYDQIPKTDLSWSHIKVLLTVDSAGERKRLAKLAVDEELTSRELAAIIQQQRRNDEKDSVFSRPKDPTFLYRAEVHSVVDADTLVLDIDLGFNVLRRQRIRLAGLNAPEPRTDKGKRAALFVTEHVLSAPLVVVKTNKVDIYGRYVGHVFLGRANGSIESTFKRGVYLNNLLVEKKLARRTT